jgi:Na+(H+)/acetate symporter ActP
MQAFAKSSGQAEWTDVTGASRARQRRASFSFFRAWALAVAIATVVGMARTITSSSLTGDVYAFVFGQQGLMGGVGLQGTKITRLNY